MALRKRLRVGWWTHEALMKIAERYDISVTEIFRAIETDGCPRGLEYLSQWQATALALQPKD